ncbi:MAG: insulinase family protein, partial [Culicoidibacterales bacterium]
GNFEVEAVMTFIRENQTEKAFAQPQPIMRHEVRDTTKPGGKKRQLTMDVSMPKIMIGIKNQEVFDIEPKQQLKNELAYDFMLDLLFGSSSKNYDQLLADGVINDSFGYSQTNDPGVGYTLMSTDTENPEAFIAAIQKIITEFDPTAIDESVVERFKRKNMGQFIRSLNSVEFIANQFTRYAFNGMNIFEVLEIMNEITQADLVVAFTQFANLENWAYTEIRS